MLHSGHRSRLKTKFLEHGFDAFDEHNILELLLFYSVPRADTNPMAHMLLNKFGNIAGVFEAPEHELTQIPGIGKKSAGLLKLIPEIAERYLASKASAPFIVASADHAGEYLLPYFAMELDEAAYILCLDGKGKVIGCRKLHCKPIDSPDFSTRAIVEAALYDNATAVIIAHNHTNGIALPTDEDIAATRKIEAALALVGVTLFDHLVVADDDFISFADDGYFNNKHKDKNGKG